jgi:thiol-disulfide isomerase/thioredoxin
MPSSTRRRALRAIGTAIGTGLAGCTGRLPTVGESNAGSPDASTSTAGAPLALPSAVTRGDFPDGRVRLVKPGRVSLLNFFTTWCTPCKREMPAFRELRAAFDRDQLHLVSITPEVDEGLIGEFWREYEGTWPVVTDPSLRATERWDATSYPTNLVFNPDGDPGGTDGPEVRARQFEELERVVESALDGA